MSTDNNLEHTDFGPNSSVSFPSGPLGKEHFLEVIDYTYFDTYWLRPGEGPTEFRFFVYPMGMRVPSVLGYEEKTSAHTNSILASMLPMPCSFEVKKIGLDYLNEPCVDDHHGFVRSYSFRFIIACKPYRDCLASDILGPHGVQLDKPWKIESGACFAPEFRKPESMVWAADPYGRGIRLKFFMSGTLYRPVQ